VRQRESSTHVRLIKLANSERNLCIRSKRNSPHRRGVLCQPRQPRDASTYQIRYVCI